MFQPLAARLACVLVVATTLLAQGPRAELIGFASLPPDTFAAGPPSGQFLSPEAKNAGFPSQPVQGFSSIRPDRERPGWWLVLCDNGYGTKANSPDFLLRIYSVKPDWRSAAGGSGTVQVGRVIQLSDPGRFVPFRLVREDSQERWLTGGDFDPESFIEAPDGTFWIGDEFGPFLLHVDKTGRLLAPPFEADGLRSPDNPAVPVPDAGVPGAATVRRSRGFEGLALGADGTRLIALLEAGPPGDAPGTTRLVEFDVAGQRFTGRSWTYRVSAAGANVTELVAYAPDRFLAIERDNAAGKDARVKRVVAIRLGVPGTSAEPTLVTDLLAIADPRSLGGLGPDFTFPFITPEAVWPEDAQTLLLVNDNNYPGGGGRQPAGSKDASEFIRLRLPRPLPR
jgi:glycerophosphoryl diester phosphodiesterase